MGSFENHWGQNPLLKCQTEPLNNFSSALLMLKVTFSIQYLLDGFSTSPSSALANSSSESDILIFAWKIYITMAMKLIRKSNWIIYLTPCRHFYFVLRHLEILPYDRITSWSQLPVQEAMNAIYRCMSLLKQSFNIWKP